MRSVVCGPAGGRAGKICLGEVGKVGGVGQPAPAVIHLPGIYVHRSVLNATPEKRMEKRTVSEKTGA